MIRAGALALVLGGCATTAAPPSGARPGLFADGAGLQPAGSALRIDFGRDKAGTVAAVSRLLGAEPTSSNPLPDCGPNITAVGWANGLSLYFGDGSFQGWASSMGRGQPVATTFGFGPGTPRTALTGVSFEETSLGTEFQRGGVYGVIEDGRADTVAAGQACFFR